MMKMQYRSKIPPKKPEKQGIPSGFTEIPMVKLLKELSFFKDKIQEEISDLVTYTRYQIEEIKKNAKGEPGRTPVKGVDYFDGDDGKTPVKGVDYFDGYTPQKGVDYFDGEPGYTPIKGKDYFDGKSVTPEECLPMLEELIPKDLVTAEQVRMIVIEEMSKDELEDDTEEETALNIDEITNSITEKVLASVDDKVKTLRAEMRQISSKAAFGGGGGMGTIKFFKFTGDGVTTAFTLPDVPTQEGSAVFAFSAGQRLHNDEQFTVSGRTLTTTYTPLTSEIIDGYIIT